MDNNEAVLIEAKGQINVARNELKNIRQQIRSMGFAYQKEMEKIQEVLRVPELLLASTTETPVTPAPEPAESTSVNLQVIGTISSWFSEKRATPRQPGVCKESRGKLTLSKNLFTNPEHTLEGLDSFSHMWLIFHFHKNNTSRVQAKVSPPRLNGGRVGVFGTRSPHRPAPIGLSLVKIDKVDDCTIYFSGVDMIDGTPVFDIKPYIPHYDSPWCLGEEQVEDTCPAGPSREAATGSSSDEEQHLAALNSGSITPSTPGSSREAPDGEEEEVESTVKVPPVRVPSWIEDAPVARLTVRFSERAVLQLVDAIGDTKEMVSAISSVLREDPRSVYLREKWSSHFYTFLIRDLHISCKFDDKMRSVTVFQVRSTSKCSVCGELEWQCTSNCQANKTSE